MSAQRLIPRDNVLPRLAQLFDTNEMARALQPLLGHRALAECSIERVKYRPQRACVVGYRLQFCDRAAAPARVAVCMYAPQVAHERYRKASEHAEAGHVALLLQYNALAWMFPHDRKLPALALLADADRLGAQRLPALVRERWGDAWEVAGFQHTIVSYFPESSCSAALKVNLRQVYEDAESQWTLYGKLRSDDGGAATYANMKALWDSAARREGQIGYAYPLGYDASLRLLWQEGVAAPTLDRELACEPGGAQEAQLWARAGAAAALLHATPLASERSLRGSDLLQAAQRAQRVLEQALEGGVQIPDAPPAEALLAASARTLGALSRAWWSVDFCPSATLHGDLHSNNILVGARHMTLIDLDGVARGPAAAELGSLLAELINRACVARRPLPLEAIAALAGAYQSAAQSALAGDQLAWFTACALLSERAYRAVTSLKPGRLQALPRLLDIAQQLLDGRCVLPVARTRAGARPAGVTSAVFAAGA